MGPYLLKTLERTAAAYVATFLGYLVADGFDVTSAAAYGDAATSALPALFMALLAVVGPFVGNKGTPELLPRSVEGRQE